MGQTNGVKIALLSLGSFAFLVVCAAEVRAGDPGVRIDLASKSLVHAGGSTPIALPSIASSSLEEVPIAPGKAVTHVRAAAEGGATWEAIVARDRVVFAGRTGYARGQPGGQSGEVVQILPRAETTRFVLVGEIEEDRVICGQTATPLSPRVLDPASMALRGASVQRLSVEQREAAKPIVAAARRGPAPNALGRLLSPAGASTGSAQALVDGDFATAWSEARPGVGQGEFVTFHTPHEVALTSLALTFASPTAKAEGAAPRSFFLVTEGETFAVTMPEDAWLHPGEAYEVPLPAPIHTTCVSIVLDTAYDHGRAAPEVSIAEVVAFSSFDGPAATAEQAARALAGGGARADEAAAVLKRAAGGLAAVRAVYTELDAPGRAMAMDVAASAPACEASAPLLVMGLGDGDREVVRKAREKLLRCGKAGAAALADAVRDAKASPRARALAATVFADVAPHEALAPLADAGADGDADVRAGVRNALAHAAKHATRDQVAALLEGSARPPEARLTLVRALSVRLADARAEADRAIDDLFGGAPTVRTRYLLAAPVAALARAGDGAAVERLAKLLTEDPDWPVRARAAEVAGDVPRVQTALVRAAADPEPRVREAALRAAAAAKAIALAPEAARRLADDPWTFVRIAAAGVLAAMPRSSAADAALAKALSDSAPRVRASAAAGLAARGASSETPALIARLEDDDEDPEVRVAVARAIGRVCGRAAVDALTKLGARGASPVATEDERAVGLAAIEALGRIHPPDLATRMQKVQPKDATAMSRRAAARALAETEVCR